MLEFCDTHCHLQFPQYKLDGDEVIRRAIKNGVSRLITVGTTAADSQQAVELAKKYNQIWATVGLHPHYAKDLESAKLQLANLIQQPKVIAIGECGLDYYYNHSPKEDQIAALKWQIELALKNDLPIIFHIRDAYDDFWPIVGKYPIKKAVAHCFSAGSKELDEILKRGWCVGLNGIVTFTKNPEQLAAFKAVPLDKLLLETDAPYLTPAPLRGKVNEPKNVVVIAEFLSDLRGEPLGKLAAISAQNVQRLFGI